MYAPGKFDWLIPTGISLINLGIEHRMSPDWNVRLFVELPIAFVVCAGTAYFWKHGLLVEEYEKRRLENDTYERDQITEGRIQRAAEEYVKTGGNTSLPVKNMRPPEPEQVAEADGFNLFSGIRNATRMPSRVVNQAAVQQAYIPVPDKRWQDWAVAIINGQPTTQARWTGHNQKFSKTEYSKQINVWLDGNPPKLVYKNPKNKADGFKPNRAEGWRYFNRLATGEEYIPLPHKN